MPAKKILITGANGFIGRNLTAELLRTPDIYELLCADIDTPREQLLRYIKECEFVVHLAGVNRPKDEKEFAEGNAGFTRFLLDTLAESGNAVPVAMTSSTQSLLDNPYGKSKFVAEQAVIAYGKENNTPIYVFRLPNVFGKWGRPNYNSAVATFCYNVSHDLPIQVSDRGHELTLVYIDDVLDMLKAAVADEITQQADGYCLVPVTYTATLGYIADKLYEFHDIKKTLVVPPLGNRFDRTLYSTYLSYYEPDSFAYYPEKHSDDRGLFAELFRSEGHGQFSVSTTKPGITRGNHWHHTKVEKFIVVSGEASIRLRKIDGDNIIEYRVTGWEPAVVDIPPGYTHLLENISETEMLVTLIWANEIFDTERPDTYFLEV